MAPADTRRVSSLGSRQFDNVSSYFPNVRGEVLELGWVPPVESRCCAFCTLCTRIEIVSSDALEWGRAVWDEVAVFLVEKVPLRLRDGVGVVAVVAVKNVAECVG